MRGITCPECGGLVGYAYSDDTDADDARRLDLHKETQSHRSRMAFPEMRTALRHALSRAGILSREQLAQWLAANDQHITEIGVIRTREAAKWLREHPRPRKQDALNV